jgi:hypothetical protein
MAETYTVTANFTDVSFRPDECLEYGLSLIFSEQEVSVCMADFRKSRMISLQRFRRTEPENPSLAGNNYAGFQRFFEELFMNLPYLRSGFKMHRIAYMAPRYTLIPGPLYELQTQETYLANLYGSQPGNRTLTDYIDPIDAHLVFSVPDEIFRTVDGTLERKRIFSYSTVLLRSILINYGRVHQPRVYLNVRTGYLDMIVIQNRQLQFFNSFVQHCSDDITYFLIFTMEQLNLNPEQIPVVMLGDTGEDGTLQERLFSYVRHIEFAKRSSFFKFSPDLGDIPAHSHYPLFNFLSCGL